MVWGILLIALITGGLVTCMIAIIKWLLALLGVL